MTTELRRLIRNNRMDREKCIQVKCNLSSEFISKEKIMDMLPDWRTIIDEAEILNEEQPQLQLKLLIAAQSVDEILQWVEEFEEKTKTTFSVRSTEKCTGRYVSFKQRRYCQHNTRCGRSNSASVRGTSKNTNCPAKMTITLRAVKSRHRHKKKNSPHPDFPCEVEVIVTHNHSTDTPDKLKFRPVCDDVRQTLINLYQIGHTAATALETIKMDICLKHEDYEKVLADRKYCPNYQYCYYVYSVFKEEYEQLDFKKKGKEVIIKLLLDLNRKTEDNSAQICFDDNDYVICICPPLMKRVHENIESSSEMVLMDASKTVDGCRIYILLTYTECGGLPLGVIVTSSERSNLLVRGLQLLKHVVGDTIFHGNVAGPKVFLTNDSSVEIMAIKTVWPDSKSLLCSFDVLQTMWRWLIKAKNGISQELQHFFFQEFKAVLYSTTIRECFEKYKSAKSSAQPYPNYCKYLDQYWDHKELWALCYRDSSTKENKIATYSEVSMKFLKEKIFHSVKTFNVIQMVHFLTTNFIDCYKVRLLNVVNNKLNESILDKPNTPPPEGLIEKIQCLSDNMALVPSEDEDLFYIVNTDVLMCTCFNINTIRICKHVDWACCLIYPEKFITALDNLTVGSIYYKIATGDWLLPLNDNENGNSPQATVVYGSESDIVNMEMNYEIEINENYQKDVKTCQEIMEEFVQIVTPFVERSPHELLPALKTMKEKALSLKTVSEMVSAFSAFGNNFQEDGAQKVLHSDNGAILSGKCKGRPRKLLISKRNGKSYLLSERILEKLKESSES